MNYREKLIASSSENCLCLGLDPQEALCPIELESMYIRLLEALSSRGLAPAAFKPNIGYFSAMDRPRELSFRGSRLLCT
ncbi:MAG: orotidine-5'-phosphate decarboxylase, partial [Sphaerochaetaceae bacterium]